MLEIETVCPESLAAELELAPQDQLWRWNGQAVADVLDLRLLEKAAQMVLEIRKFSSGQTWEIELEKDPDEPLGIEVRHPQPRSCCNNCLFCFVRQQPPGLRPSLSVRDDDYRFSYLYGAYITLTNVTAQDWQRIVQWQLSPLYVSVHATEPHVRQHLMGHSQPLPVLPHLQRLVDAGICLHTQIVLCPGYNDGPVLSRTIGDLAALGPNILSVAVVPVGVTAWRQGLQSLTPVDERIAAQVITEINIWQEYLRPQRGCGWVYAADEMYLLAGQSLPEVAAYDDLCQLENGVGMMALFAEESQEILQEATPLGSFGVACVTGERFGPYLAAFARQLQERTGVAIQVIPVANGLFGASVTAAGLVSGQDVATALQNALQAEDLVLVPEVMLDHSGKRFLDDWTLADLAAACGRTVQMIPATPAGLLEALEEWSWGHDQEPQAGS